MVVVPNWGQVKADFCWAFVAWSVPPFIVAISALVEYRRSLISRPDLFCDRKYLVATTFETNVQRVFKCFLWFFKLSYKTFHIFPSRVKERMLKNWIHVCFNIWINRRCPKGQTNMNLLLDFVLIKK